MRTWNNCRVALLSATLGVIGSSSAYAANDTWDNGGGDNNWQNIANWLSDTQFPGLTSGNTSTDIATFDATGPTGTINLGDTINVGGIVINAAAPTLTLGDANDTLVFSAAATYSTAGTVPQFLGVTGTTITQAGATTYTNTGTGVLTIAGNVGGVGSTVTKTGTGTMVLSGTNSWTGTTTISGGLTTISGTTGSLATPTGVWTQGTAAANTVEVPTGGSLYTAGYTVGGASTTPTLRLNGGTININGTVSGNNGNSSQASQPYLIDLASGSFTATNVGLGRTAQSVTSLPTGGNTTYGLYVHGAIATITNALNIGTTSGTNSSVNARVGGSGGSTLTVGGLTTVGLNNAGRYSILDVTDNATYNGNGGLQLGSGFAGQAVFALRSNGVANISTITMGNAVQTGNMALQLQGGTLNVGAGGIQPGPVGATPYTTIINVGLAASTTAITLGAAADWSSPLKMTLLNSTTAGTPVFRASDGAATPVAHNISLSGVLSGTGGLTKTGAGSLTLSGANTYTGLSTVKAGSLILGTAAQAPALTGGGVDVQSTGKLVFDYTGGTSPVAAVKTALDNAYLASPTFATGQIKATTLAAGQTIGYGDNGTDTVTVRITLPGDADLDGDVDFNDFLALQTNFGAAGTRFDQGNFNYDAATDFNDFLALQTNFGQSVGFGPVVVTAEQVAAMTAFASNPLNQAVPEPASLALLGLGAAGLLRRRR